MDTKHFMAFDALSLYLVKFWQGLDSKSISTFVIVLGVLVLRAGLIRWMERHTDISPYLVNKWRQRLRNIALGFILLSVVVIWAPELRTFAVTMVAVAAAIVIAFKELITCLIGTVVRGNVEGARIGGRIILNNAHGDVVSTDLLSTTVLEVNENGQRTGRTIVVPNSMFINNITVTEAADDLKYVLMNIDIPVMRNDDWQAVENVLLHVSQEITEPYIKEAKKYFARINRRYGFSMPGPEPRILIQWNDATKITLSLRLAVLVGDENKIRQQVLRAALTKLDSVAAAVPQE